MAMRDHHFVDINGNHFVVPMAPDDYERTDGSSRIDAPPTPEHRWVGGRWIAPSARQNILNAPLIGFGGPTAKELFNGNR